MKTTALLCWVGRDMVQARLRSGVAIIAIGLGVGVLTVIVALGLGARRYLLESMAQQLPFNIIEVKRRTVDWGVLAVTSDNLFASPPLNQESRALLSRLPHVVATYPKLNVPIPMGARGLSELFGRPLYTDLLMNALPEDLIGEELTTWGRDLFQAAGAPQDGSATSGAAVIPVVVSKQLIDIYNSTVAPALAQPQMTNATLNGLEFDIIFGRSRLFGDKGEHATVTRRARIVGTSDFALRLGVTVPLSIARQLNAAFQPSDASVAHLENYSAILVRAAHAADIAPITRAIEEMGFSVDQSAQRVRDAITLATAGASLLGVLVLLLAALHIAHSMLALLNERRMDLAILRAVGATRRDLTLLIMCHATTLGLLGALVGLTAARLCAWLAPSATAFLPNHWAMRPESLIMFPWWLYGVGLAAALCAAIAGTIGPTWQLHRTSLVRCLIPH